MPELLIDQLINSKHLENEFFIKSSVRWRHDFQMIAERGGRGPETLIPESKRESHKKIRLSVRGTIKSPYTESQAPVLLRYNLRPHNAVGQEGGQPWYVGDDDQEKEKNHHKG